MRWLASTLLPLHTHWPPKIKSSAHTHTTRFETRRDDPLWLSCLFAPLGAALRYALALWMARSAVRFCVRCFAFGT